MKSSFSLEEKNSTVMQDFLHQNLFFRKNYWVIVVMLSLASFCTSTAWSQAATLPLESNTKSPISPKYAAKDIQRVFSFMDVNKDGEISREEAAGFRNIAKHFDEADIDKNDLLSYEEFENALNGNKSQ